MRTPTEQTALDHDAETARATLAALNRDDRAAAFDDLCALVAQHADEARRYRAWLVEIAGDPSGAEVYAGLALMPGGKWPPSRRKDGDQ